MDETKLVHGQMDWAVVWARTDRDVTVGRKDNGERGSVGGGNGGQHSDDGLARENRDVVNRDNVSADVFATDIPNASSGGACGDAGQVAALADVTSGNLEAKGRMIAFDGLRDGAKAMKWVVRDLKIERGQGRTISGDDTVGGQEAKSLYVGRGVGEIVHPLVKTSMSCSFDKGTGQIKIVQDFEIARVA
jgi:hypothetical protein